MSFFKFLESKYIPRDIFKSRGYFKQKLSKKMSYLAASISSSICRFLKMPETLNHLELEANVFMIFIPL